MPKAKTVKKPVGEVKLKKPAVPQAAAEQFFVLVDGRVLRNYKELADMLDDMADHVYSHHANNERNDFAKWIEDVFKDTTLAKKIREATGKHHCQILIYRHIIDKL